MDSKENSRRRHKRHHHRKSRQQRKQQKMLILGLVAAMVLVGLAAAVVVNKLKEQKNYHVTGANSVDVGAGYRYTEYNGKKYQYNNRVTTLLYAGLDSFDELKQTATYGDKARADSIKIGRAHV